MSTSDPTPPPPPGYGQPPPPGYGQQPYGQQPYAQQPYGYGYGRGPETEPLAVVALVLAIASWVMCIWFLPLPGIAAIVVATYADRAIESSGGRKTGEGLSKAARIISWVHIGLFTAVLVVTIIVAVILAASDSS